MTKALTFLNYTTPIDLFSVKQMCSQSDAFPSMPEVASSITIKILSHLFYSMQSIMGSTLTLFKPGVS